MSKLLKMSRLGPFLLSILFRHRQFELVTQALMIFSQDGRYAGLRDHYKPAAKIHVHKGER
jgi:hypothetical protein